MRSPRVLFTYWGRRGLSRFALELAQAAASTPGLAARLSVSRQNESFAAFAALGDAVVPIDTFERNSGALLMAWRLPLIRRQLIRYIGEHRPDAVIELMPHVWSSFLAPAIRGAGVRYVTTVHDARPHPGDHRSLSVDWLLRRSIRQADLVLTLSATVADTIAALGEAPRERISPLFHPDLRFGRTARPAPPRPGEPLRLVFFGRIMPYKGLPLFVDMVTELRRQGLAVEAGVFGEGALGGSAERLTALGATVINRWLSEAEIADLLPRYHAVVLSHIEASQSGVAAAAAGAGLPVIATPVGGLAEQIGDGTAGVVATAASAPALAEAARRLLLDPDLYRKVCHSIDAMRDDRSMARFVELCVSRAVGATIAGPPAS